MRLCVCEGARCEGAGLVENVRERAVAEVVAEPSEGDLRDAEVERQSISGDTAREVGTGSKRRRLETAAVTGAGGGLEVPLATCSSASVILRVGSRRRY